MTFGTLYISTYRKQQESKNFDVILQPTLEASEDRFGDQTIAGSPPSNLWRWAQILFQAGFCNTLGVTICFWALLADGILPTFDARPIVKVIVSTDHLIPLLFYFMDSFCSMTVFEWRYFSVPLLIGIVYTIFNIVQTRNSSTATYSVLDWKAHPKKAAVT